MIGPQEQETLQRLKGFGVPSHGEGGQPVCLQRLQRWVGSWTSIYPEPSLPTQKAKIDLGDD